MIFRLKVVILFLMIKILNHNVIIEYLKRKTISEFTDKSRLSYFTFTFENFLLLAPNYQNLLL